MLWPNRPSLPKALFENNKLREMYAAAFPDFCYYAALSGKKGCTDKSCKSKHKLPPVKAFDDWLDSKVLKGVKGPP